MEQRQLSVKKESEEKPNTMPATMETLENTINGIINGTNNLVIDENSNKNSSTINVQRDLIAGEVSKLIGLRKWVPADVIDAHNRGVIHIHDADYFLSPGQINCCLPNFRDMLLNGTVINGVAIESPKSFHTACTILTQIIASISGNQYGGQSVNDFPDVLAPFVRRSWKKHYTFVKNLPGKHDETECDELAWKLTKKEIRDGLQTIQYQINTLVSGNGQSPFLTLFLHFDKDGEYATEAAMIVEELLQQRIRGVKNEKGVYITPTFPKLIYVLDGSNVSPSSPYFYLTKLAAECTMKRMYPDYISAPLMRENYDGNVFSPMGCVAGDAPVRYRIGANVFVESFAEMWERIAATSTVKEQKPGDKRYLYIDTTNVGIWDTKEGDYVVVKRIIRNMARHWQHVFFSSATHSVDIIVTSDHVFDTENRGIIQAKDLLPDDTVMVDVNWGESYRGVGCRNVQSLKFCKSEPVLYSGDVPSFDVTTESEHFEVSGVYSHNCRSFLPPYVNKDNEYQFEGRFNKGVCTINLPNIGLTVGKGNVEEFFALLDERLEQYVKPALIARHNFVASGTTSSSPIHWCYGGLARLPLGVPIPQDYLYGYYSTLSIGYIGIEEACQAVLGESHTTPRGTEFALHIMQHLNAAKDKWNSENFLGFSVYGTPAESLTAKACLKDTETFGGIPHVTDKGFYTNSYHVHVEEPMNVFEKFDYENQFQALSQGGCISYAELGDMGTNIEAMLALLRYGYEHIQYFEFNLRGLDYCSECGFSGESHYDEGRNVWECPMCGNDSKESLYVVRRSCGYLGSNRWLSGRAKEINARVTHI